MIAGDRLPNLHESYNNEVIAMLPDVKLIITPPVRLYEETKRFLKFLSTAAQKHLVTLSYSTNDLGTFELSIPGKESWDLDSFLQEIIFHRGLYYYLCGVPNRREVAKKVVTPIFEKLCASRFSVTYPVQIQKHLITGTPHWAGGELLEETAHQFEILFQKLNLKEVGGFEFVRDTDDLLTEWMLRQLRHPKGSPSPKFNALVGMCAQRNILRTKEARKLFDKVHSLRTRGLHRLEREIADSEVAKIAQDVYYMFEWIDDYLRAQNEKTVRLSGKRYRRIRYGKEPVPKNAPDEFAATWLEVIKRPCHDCGVICGEIHLDGCDMERCPRCGGQYLCCACRIEEDDE
jgi:hypothetical protein